MENLAARRALTSTGVIGLSALLLTKVANIDLKVSLPIGMAAGLATDYLTNLDEYRKAIKIFSGRLREHEKRGTHDPYMASVMTAILAILALNRSTIITGRYRDLFELGDGDDDDDDEDDQGPPGGGGLVHYGKLFARRSWNVISRVRLIEGMTALCRRIVGSLGTSIRSAGSATLYPRPPASPDEAEQFRQMQANMQEVWQEIVDLAQDDVPRQVREELDEKMPEEVVATIIPPERPEEIDAFVNGLPNIPEPRQRIVILKTAGGQEAALLLNPYTGRWQGSVSEIPVVHLPQGHVVQEQLAIMSGEPSEAESSVFYVPKADTKAIQQRDDNRKRLDSLKLTMDTLFPTWMTLPEGAARDKVLAQMQELDHEYEEQMGFSYLHVLAEEWKEDHPE